MIFNKKLKLFVGILVLALSDCGGGDTSTPPNISDISGTNCNSGELVSQKNTNPIEKYQWYLDGDTSQTSFGMYASEMASTVHLNLDRAWCTDGCQGQGVLISVVDTGLQISHPDLAANIGAGRGYDFTSHKPGDYWAPDPKGDTDPSPTGGDHGTSVAGLIAMVDNEIGGVVLLQNPNC